MKKASKRRAWTSVDIRELKSLARGKTPAGKIAGKEAERCNEIAYIAYGKLLVHGTVEQVIAASHLTTYAVSAEHGEGLSKISDELTGRPGVDMVAQFGTSLHVSGREPSALDAAIAAYRERKDLTWTTAAPSLEDVFIDLMGKSKDNFQ